MYGSCALLCRSESSLQISISLLKFYHLLSHGDIRVLNACFGLPAGPFMGKKRMFSWNAPNTYYKELATQRLERSLDDKHDSKLFRTDAPKVVRAFGPSVSNSPRLECADSVLRQQHLCGRFVKSCLPLVFPHADQVMLTP